MIARKSLTNNNRLIDESPTHPIAWGTSEKFPPREKSSYKD